MATATSEIDPTSSAAIVINDRFGGLAKYCAMSGDATSTVWGWLKRGTIPTGQIRHIMDVAQKHRVKLKDSDFIPKAVA